MRKKAVIIRKRVPEKLRTSSHRRGGIGHYYSGLEKHLSKDIGLFDFQSNMHNQSFYMAVILFIRSYINLFASILKNETEIYILNPSLGRIGIVRDGFILALFKMFRKKIIIFFRGWHPSTEQLIDKIRLVTILFKWTYNKADSFIVLSDVFRNKLREWGFKQTIFIETTIVDDGLIEMPEEYRNNSEVNIKILFLTRIEKYKGIYEMIEAFSVLVNKYPTLSLIVAGDGGEINEIKSIVNKREIKNVDFRGYVTGTDKQRAFSESDIYVFPSYSEGMPNSVLEAMAFGLPVVTRSVGGLRDFFEHGKMGFITDSLEPSVFAGYIEQLVLNSELRKQISAYNADFAKRHFLASVAAKRLESIIDDVLSSTSKDRTWRDCSAEDN